MKTTNYFYLVLIFISCSYWSAFAQDFIRMDAEQNGKQITVAVNQVLELRLPCKPSTGYAWYLRNDNNELIHQVDGIVEQIGNWEFIADRPDPMPGASGQQIIRFIGKAAGTTNLHLAYVQPWLEGAPLQQYSVSVTSEGAYTGTYKAPADVKVAETTGISKSPTLPAKFSWLDENIMTPVPTNVCGSSWAFAACAQFEANIKRFDKVTRNLSEQWLINCDEDKYNCDGGKYPGNMFQKYGAVYEADAPFKGMNEECKSSYPYHEKILGGYTDMGKTPTIEQLKEAIYIYGPVWAEMVAGNNFYKYTSGILTESDPGEINHAIVLVGWNDSTESFVLRNSWGSAWGEHGYMRIKYGISRVGEHATYMIYKDPATGINEQQAFSSIATIYPNPSLDDKITVQLNRMEDSNTQLTITINDIQGRAIFKQDAKPNTTMEINTQAFSEGMYFVNISSDKHSANYKIIKQ